MAIPALRTLRRRPADTLVIAAQPRIGRLLETLGVVDRSVDFETLGLDALFEPAPGGFEPGWPARCTDDLRRATRVVAWFGSRDPHFVRRLTSLAPRAVVAPSVRAGRPVWEHLVDTAGGTPLDRAMRDPVTVPAALVEEARRVLVQRGWNERARLLFVHPGAGGRGKRWPSAAFAAVLEGPAALPRLTVVIHRGPADSEAVAALPAHLTGRAIVLREPPLPLLAGALSHTTVYLGNDSGISHLAAAVGVRSVVLFAADRVAWRPWAEHVEPLVVSMATPEESDTARVMAGLATLLG